MIRIVAGIFFVAHGLVHLLWFGVYWRYFTVDTIPYSTSIAAGRVQIGDVGIRIVGLLWVIAALLWGVAGIGLLFLLPWWPAMTIAATLYSSIMCMFDLGNAKYGLLINLIVLGLLFLNGHYQWL